MLGFLQVAFFVSLGFFIFALIVSFIAKGRGGR